MIGRSGERASGISVLPANHDDDDDLSIYEPWVKEKLADSAIILFDILGVYNCNPSSLQPLHFFKYFYLQLFYSLFR